MKQYMLSVHSAEGQQLPPPEEVQQTYADVDAFNGELRAEGAWVFAGGLYPPTRPPWSACRAVRSLRWTARSRRPKNTSAASG